MTRIALVLRSALFNAWYLGTGFALSLAGALFCRSPACALRLARCWARCTLWGLRVLCRIRLRLDGAEHLPRGPALLACEHQSAFDTVVWHALLPHAAYVLKRELTTLPLFGRLTLLAGMIPVDRDGGTASMRRLMRDGQVAARAGCQIVIFPQGTRADPDDPVTLQPGIAALARSTGLPVVPVTTDSGRCWGRRAFLKQPGIIHIRLLPPLPAGLPRAVLMQRLVTAFEAVDNDVRDMCDPLAQSGSKPAQVPANEDE